MAFWLVVCGFCSLNHSGSPEEPLPATGVDLSVLKLYIQVSGFWESDRITVRVYCEMKVIRRVMEVVQQRGKSGS